MSCWDRTSHFILYWDCPILDVLLGTFQSDQFLRVNAWLACFALPACISIFNSAILLQEFATNKTVCFDCWSYWPMLRVCLFFWVGSRVTTPYLLTLSKSTSCSFWLLLATLGAVANCDRNSALFLFCISQDCVLLDEVQLRNEPCTM
jgi:hypothetical protein